MGKDINGKKLPEGISQRKDGRYIARFTSKNGKRVQKYFDKVNEAKKWLIDSKYEDEHSIITTKVNVTVNAWFDYWIKMLKSQQLDIIQ